MCKQDSISRALHCTRSKHTKQKHTPASFNAWLRAADIGSWFKPKSNTSEVIYGYNHVFKHGQLISMTTEEAGELGKHSKRGQAVHKQRICLLAPQFGHEAGHQRRQLKQPQRKATTQTEFTRTRLLPYKNYSYPPSYIRRWENVFYVYILLLTRNIIK